MTTNLQVVLKLRVRRGLSPPPYVSIWQGG